MFSKISPYRFSSSQPFLSLAGLLISPQSLRVSDQSLRVSDPQALFLGDDASQFMSFRDASPYVPYVQPLVRLCLKKTLRPLWHPKIHGASDRSDAPCIKTKLSSQEKGKMNTGANPSKVSALTAPRTSGHPARRSCRAADRGSRARRGRTYGCRSRWRHRQGHPPRRLSARSPRA